MKDHSVLEALAASLDDEEDKDSGAGFAQRFDEKQQFSAVFEGKARRIAKIMDTRVHQRMEQAQVQWLDSTTAWVGVQDLSGLTQQHVRSLMHGEEDSEDEKDIDEQENVNSKKRKRRRKSITQNGARDKKLKRKEQRKKRQKQKEAEELDAKISMCVCCAMCVARNLCFTHRCNVGHS